MTQATKPGWVPQGIPAEGRNGAGLERQRAWVEVDPAAIATNARSLCRHIGPGSRLMAVVKADGYGHGAVTVAQAALAGEPTVSVWPPWGRGSNCAGPASTHRCW